MLYMLASPIGNLDDITYRAVKILAEVDLVACEDTRHTIKLLNRYNIKKPLFSCHGYNEGKSADKMIKELKDGKKIAYVSDAGTPGLSDPGALLAERVREEGFAVIPVPGPSAAAAILSVSGYKGKTVTFEGFLSPKQGRRKRRLSELLQRDEAFLLYESPFRIIKLLNDLMGFDAERRIFIGREMTKMHEEYLCGTAKELMDILEGKRVIKGEFSALVFPRKKR
jgi:16S rRNA (cytidine1402-2'-O)-methyltransferase